MRGIELLGVPSAAGTHGPGQEDAPIWVRDAGLLTGLAARGVAVRDHGDLPRVPFRPDPDHRHQQNLGLVSEVARNVAGRVAALCGGGDGPACRWSWAGTARSRSACWPGSWSTTPTPA